MVLTMSPFTAERQTVTAVFFGAVVLCVSFVSLGECQTNVTPSPPTRKLNFSLKSSTDVFTVDRGNMSPGNKAL